MKYFASLPSRIKKKLKRNYTLCNHETSRMHCLLKNIFTLSGAAVAFTKSNRIIGWSSVENSKINDVTLVCTFVSEKHRHKGYAKQLVHRCIEENERRNYLIYSHIQNRFVQIGDILYENN